jgi:ubiquinone biosynthesis protein COQ9
MSKKYHLFNYLRGTAEDYKKTKKALKTKMKKEKQPKGLYGEKRERGLYSKRVSNLVG